MICTTVITQENSWFIARCAELGVVTQGASPKEAEANLKEAVELYLEDLPETERGKTERRAIVSTMDIPHA